MRQSERSAAGPIENLQTMLRLISRIDKMVLPVIPNGAYNSNTYASVRSFQETNGLQANGITDQITWEAISDAYFNTMPLQTNPITRPAWNSDQSVAPGQFNYHLYIVQAMLRALSDFIPSIPPPAATGFLDAETEEGLHLIQTASHIDATGELNTATWNYLNALYRAIIADGTKKGTV